MTVITSTLGVFLSCSALPAECQRFLVNMPAGGEDAATTPITVVSSWQAGLKK